MVAAAVVSVAGLSAPLAQEHLSLAATTLDGAEADLASLRGRVVVLNFWATWCVPCRRELPLLARLQRRFGDRGVTFVALSTDEPVALPEVRRVAAGEAAGLVVWTGGTTDQMKAAGLPPELPATVILDREGAVVAHLPGVVEKRDVTEWLDWLLADRKGTEPEERDDHHEGHAEGEEDHQHGGVGMEGASLVPS